MFIDKLTFVAGNWPLKFQAAMVSKETTAFKFEVKLNKTREEI